MASRLRLASGCAVPDNAMITDSTGHPELSSFVATGCNSTILDVSNNRSLGNPGFSITLATSRARVP